MKNTIYPIVFLAFVVLIFTSCKDDLDPGTANTLAGLFSLFIEFVWVILVALLGAGLVGLGFWLIYEGFTGDIQMFLAGEGIEAKIVNASPGIILVILGVFLIWRSRPDIRIKK